MDPAAEFLQVIRSVKASADEQLEQARKANDERFDRLIRLAEQLAEGKAAGKAASEGLKSRQVSMAASQSHAPAPQTQQTTQPVNPKAVRKPTLIVSLRVPTIANGSKAKESPDGKAVGQKETSQAQTKEPASDGACQKPAPKRRGAQKKGAKEPEPKEPRRPGRKPQPLRVSEWINLPKGSDEEDEEDDEEDEELEKPKRKRVRHRPRNMDIVMGVDSDDKVIGWKAEVRGWLWDKHKIVLNGRWTDIRLSKRKGMCLSIQKEFEENRDISWSLNDIEKICMTICQDKVKNSGRTRRIRAARLAGNNNDEDDEADNDDVEEGVDQEEDGGTSKGTAKGKQKQRSPLPAPKGKKPVQASKEKAPLPNPKGKQPAPPPKGKQPVTTSNEKPPPAAATNKGDPAAPQENPKSPTLRRSPRNTTQSGATAGAKQPTATHKSNTSTQTAAAKEMDHQSEKEQAEVDEEQDPADPTVPVLFEGKQDVVQVPCWIFTEQSAFDQYMREALPDWNAKTGFLKGRPLLEDGSIDDGNESNFMYISEFEAGFENEMYIHGVHIYIEPEESSPQDSQKKDVWAFRDSPPLKEQQEKERLAREAEALAAKEEEEQHQKQLAEENRVRRDRRAARQAEKEQAQREEEERLRLEQEEKEKEERLRLEQENNESARAKEEERLQLENAQRFSDEEARLARLEAADNLTKPNPNIPTVKPKPTSVARLLGLNTVPKRLLLTPEIAQPPPSSQLQALAPPQRPPSVSTPEQEAALKKARDEAGLAAAKILVDARMEERRRLRAIEDAKKPQPERLMTAQEQMDSILAQAKALRIAEEKAKADAMERENERSSGSRPRNSKTPSHARKVGEDPNGRKLYGGSSLKIVTGKSSKTKAKQRRLPSVGVEPPASGWVAVAGENNFHPLTPMGGGYSKPVRQRRLSGIGRESQETEDFYRNQKESRAEKLELSQKRKADRDNLNKSEGSGPNKRVRNAW